MAHSEIAITVRQASMMRNHLTSLFLSSIYGFVLPTDTFRGDLEGWSAAWFRGVWISGIVVAFGCVLELWEVAIDLRNWRRARNNLDPLPDNPGSWMYPLAALGLFLVVGGIFSETIFEVLDANVETQLRQYDSDKITAAESAADVAITKAAEVGRDTEGLKTDAAKAKRDMVAAQLELARLTGPVHVVTVINGVARPDLSEGLIQEILLTRDVRIMAPILPDIGKDGTAPWTLFLDQDSVGSHQYTFEFMRDVKAYPGLVPNSRASFEFITDAHGRSTIRGIPLVDMPNTNTSEKK